MSRSESFGLAQSQAVVRSPYHNLVAMLPERRLVGLVECHGRPALETT